MDPTILHAKLINAARLDAPSDQVPYAFEKGVMARLESARVDYLGYWAQSLWRAVAPCAAIAMFLGAWSLLASERLGNPEEFAQHFESTIFAAATSEQTLTDRE
jgi:hypothetical protein